MSSGRKEELLVYSNCLLYLLVVIMFLYSIREIRYSEYWNSANDRNGAIYVVLLGCVVVFMAVIALGLLRFKKWARVMAIPWNLAVAFLLIGLKFVAYLVLGEGFAGYFDPSTILQTSIGVVLIFISISYSRPSMKKRFA
jgi:hypothetical protein